MLSSPPPCFEQQSSTSATREEKEKYRGFLLFFSFSWWIPSDGELLLLMVGQNGRKRPSLHRNNEDVKNSLCAKELVSV